MSILHYSAACRSTFTGVMRILITLVGLLWFGVLVIQADTHYVSLQGTNNSPYLTWASAATQIQWAVDNAVVSDTVLVSNGTYNLTNQINILTNVIVRSFTEQGHGTNDTIINGNYPAYTNRCVFMTAGTLDGFTISNGFLTNSTTNYSYGYPYPMGGAGIGIRAGAAVKNCYIYKNYITNFGGGGIHVCHATGVTISNCAVVSNICDNNIGSGRGGGIFLEYAYSGLLVDSYISGNIGGYGAGVNNWWGDVCITNCIIVGNTAGKNVGGVTLESVSGVAMANCVISNNTCGGWSGYAGVQVYATKLINSLIIGNTGATYGGVGVSAGGIMSNCQVIANTAPMVGGVYLTGVARRQL